jgi:alpha-N-arabinofuranosidase
MGIRQGETYRLTLRARQAGPAPKALRVELTAADGRVLAATSVSGLAPEWNSHSAILKATATEARARLAIHALEPGTLDVDLISLFPANTWKNRANGWRKDLVQLLAEMKPGFLRFPGGCIVEGRRLTNRYQWKTTVGNPLERKLIVNRWNDEFKHRPAPDYYQSFGLGFYEYFLLCEDIGAEPLPILNCGMACQFNSGELAPLSQLDPYLQDALDLVEFANGPVSSPWGQLRASLGHPQPFHLKLLGVGNEQWGPDYLERYAVFHQALKAKHPEIKLVSSAGPGPDDERYHFAWPKLRAINADIVDEHCYARPDWFLDNAARYDSFIRQGPQIFMGEYAAQSVKTVSPDNRNNWECALAEAAYMSGLERNADLVVMSSYAPLFGHVERWQWTPNLIWFDNLRAYGTPSYYVQKLFANHRGDTILPTRITGPAAAQAKPRVFASATRDQKTGEIILKVINATANPVEVSILLAGAKGTLPKGREIVLTSPHPTDENSLDHPKRVAPIENPLSGVAPEFRHWFKPNAVHVLRIGAASTAKKISG